MCSVCRCRRGSDRRVADVERGLRVHSAVAFDVVEQFFPVFGGLGGDFERAVVELLGNAGEAVVFGDFDGGEIVVLDAAEDELGLGAVDVFHRHGGVGKAGIFKHAVGERAGEGAVFHGFRVDFGFADFAGEVAVFQQRAGIEFEAAGFFLSSLKVQFLNVALLKVRFLNTQPSNE